MKNKTRRSSAPNPKQILESLLAQAPFDGWTDAAYDAALKKANVTRADADKLFPRGLIDLVELFGEQMDAVMLARIKAERGFVRFRVRDKITFAIRARLEALGPHREAMRRLMIWYALPHHLPYAVKRLSTIADAIWKAAGDTSTDYNFYTKRILLAGVIKATTLFWLGDDSDGHQATWDFLDRRIADVMKLGKGISFLKEFEPSEIIDMLRGKIKRAI